MGQTAFSLWLTEKMTARGWNQATLAERSKLSRQYISSLINSTPHTITGKPIKPTEEAVDKLAKALGVPLTEARLIAGYAPTDTSEFQDQIEDEDIAYLASDYKELKKLTPEEEQAEIRTVIKMVRSELSRRLETARAKKKKK